VGAFFWDVASCRSCENPVSEDRVASLVLVEAASEKQRSSCLAAPSNPALSIAATNLHIGWLAFVLAVFNIWVLIQQKISRRIVITS
jgi:hypothetical protein